MRLAFVCLFVWGCGSSGATNLLCTYCETDDQCRGNPCFQDVSGGRFCGKPCDSGCPSGYSCQTVVGTNPGTQRTCFPDSEQCMPPGSGGGDMALSPGTLDLAGADLTPPPLPVGGPVGPTGGTVDRLFFGFTGDTRPTDCDGPYPQAVANGIFAGLKSQNVQFAVDQGDHMYNCLGGYNGAAAQMADYLAAASIFGNMLFMTMGNHECTGESTNLCTVTSYGGNHNYTAYMDTLRKLGFQSPYYRFDVTTSTGLAVFLVVADDVWDATEQSWLTQQLTDADAHAKYTFVSKHHPDGNMDHPEFQTIFNLVTAHKYTLFFTGHTHEYRRDRKNPRTMIIGCGGAPVATGGFFGYGTAQQEADDSISVNVYDEATGNVMDSFSVSPQ
jgi:Calcineurin-like phosphoesterase